MGKRIGGTMPATGVELREKWRCPCQDHHRDGTGDNSTGGTWRYHPKLNDIFLMKHTTHCDPYFQQYGLDKCHGKFSPGHKGFRLQPVEKQGLRIKYEGSVRPCGEGTIVGGWSDKDGGSAVCGKISK